MLNSGNMATIKVKYLAGGSGSFALSNITLTGIGMICSCNAGIKFSHWLTEISCVLSEDHSTANVNLVNVVKYFMVILQRNFMHVARTKLVKGNLLISNIIPPMVVDAKARICFL